MGYYSLAFEWGENRNRVLKVDPQSAYALLEPGVSYFDLHVCLVKHNLRDQVWGDVPDVGGGSVIGKCSKEVLDILHTMITGKLLDDDALRMAHSALGWALCRTLKRTRASRHMNRNQTRAGSYLSISSVRRVLAYMITFPRDNDLDQIVEIPRPLRISGVIQNTFKLDNVLVSAALQSHRTKYTNSDKPLTDLMLDEIAQNLTVGRWNLSGAMYRSLIIRDALWSVIKASFSKIAGAKVYFPEDRPNDIILQTRSDTMQGTPVTTELELLP
ncbi:hypothetical protein BDV38DRAFT_286195 [Aspergillus pseudotamarii]|uniref:Uncharacterized protein n=1 Tax=Aspergillus pseudotamarii TaxID=132259 RepID=A0A5N6SHK0_ASPPS|nr:uncharacterized protein BDV38DRAFT_286195 [Aspergillus pseudotamarii]KAE8134166.1 hypothetical protein BDV38DRAFT_286195 [Aspergillus pseudotamarii]